jgi:hypothetical protein
MLLLVYTVVSAQQQGWGSARTVGSFAAVAVLLGVFCVIESRSRDPLVPFAIFSSGALRRANVGAVTLFGSYISFQFLVTQYLQTLSGWSALSTALAFLPAGVTVVVLSTRMAPLLGRFGPAPLTAVAFSCLVIAYVVFLRAGVVPDYPAVMLPAVILLGLAFGLGFSSLSVAATAGVPNAEQGLAASLFQTSFQVGGAVVLAIVTAVVDAAGAARVVSPSATLAAYRPALFLITGVAAVGDQCPADFGVHDETPRAVVASMRCLASGSGEAVGLGVRAVCVLVARQLRPAEDRVIEQEELDRHGIRRASLGVPPVHKAAVLADQALERLLDLGVNLYGLCRGHVDPAQGSAQVVAEGFVPSRPGGEAAPGPGQRPVEPHLGHGLCRLRCLGILLDR